MKAKYLTEGDLVSCRNTVVTTNGKKSAEVIVATERGREGLNSQIFSNGGKVKMHCRDRHISDGVSMSISRKETDERRKSARAKYRIMQKDALAS